MSSFFQKKSKKPKKLEHEVLAAGAHYREMTGFMLMISFLAVGILANFFSAYYDASHPKQSVTNASSLPAQTASSTSEMEQY